VQVERQALHGPERPERVGCNRWTHTTGILLDNRHRVLRPEYSS